MHPTYTARTSPLDNVRSGVHTRGMDITRTHRISPSVTVSRTWHIGRIARNAVLTASAALAIFAGSSSSTALASPLMDQSSFPCQEDEVLGYAPQFGPDKVGCIHVDDLRSS